MSANTIKLVAIAAMLIDHIAWGFVPTGSFLGFVMHSIGRVTAPVMCYFITEGYRYTHNIKRYALRLGIFAMLSQLPFSFFETGNMFCSTGNVGYMLLLSLLALLALDKIQNRFLRIFTLVCLCCVSLFCDWGVFGILFTFVFWIYHDDFKSEVLRMAVLSVCLVFRYSGFYQLGILLSLPLLHLYNGEQGSQNYSKWGFYIFYPAHLLVLGLIRWNF